MFFIAEALPLIEGFNPHNIRTKMEYSIDTIIVRVHKTKTKNIIYVQNTF